MDKDYFDTLNDLIEKDEPFTIATVIKIEGSASAKPGSKAIFDSSGNRLTGWVGGGCAESTAAQESINSINSEKPKIIELDLDDEVLGAGMPCGGTMELFIEPYLPTPKLLIIGHGKIAETLAKLGFLMNFSVVVNDPIANEDNFPTADKLTNTDFEELEIGKNTYVIVATQHKGDHLSLNQALKSDCPYIALIASKKRTELTFQYLIDLGIPNEDLQRIRAPAGLDIGGITPEEIALSIMSEIVVTRRGGTYQPLTDVKKINFQKLEPETK